MLDVRTTLLRAHAHLVRAASAAAEGVPHANRPDAASIAQVRSTYAIALDQARDAVRELESLGDLSASTRAHILRAVERIGPTDAVGFGATYNTGLQPGATQLALARDRLELEANLRSLSSGEARRQVTAALDEVLNQPDPAIDHETTRQVVMYAGLPEDLRPRFPQPLFGDEFEDLVGYGHTVDGNGQVSSEFASLRMEQERRAIHSDPSSSRAEFDTEVRAILAIPEEDLTQDHVRRISILSGLGDDLRPGVLDVPPASGRITHTELGARNWEIAKPGSVREMLYRLRMPIEHERLLADPNVTDHAARTLVRLLAKPAEALTSRETEQLWTLAHLPEHSRPSLPELGRNDLRGIGITYDPTDTRYDHATDPLHLTRAHLARTVDPQLLASELDSLGAAVDPIHALTLRSGIRQRALIDQLEAMTPDQARAASTHRLATLLARPDAQIDEVAMWELADLAALPDQLRPPLPSSVRSDWDIQYFARQGILPTADDWARGDLAAQRLELRRIAIEADAASNRDAFTAELDEILATPDEAITQAQLERVALMSALRHDLRPTRLDTPEAGPNTSWFKAAAMQWLPASSGGTTAKLDALRMTMEHEAAIASGQVTAGSAERELVRLLLQEPASLSIEDTRRVSWLARLPEAVRPSLPPTPPDSRSIADAGLQGTTGRQYLGASAAFAAARRHLLEVADESVVIEEMRHVLAHRMVELETLATFQARMPAAAAALGITRSVLEDQAISALAIAGEKGRQRELAPMLHVARTGLERLPQVDGPLAVLRDQTLELVTRNIDRMSGSRQDTFGRHPDYAEVGRVVANLRLLNAASKSKDAIAEHIAW